MNKKVLVFINIISTILIVFTLCCIKITVGESNIYDMITSGNYIESFDFKEKTNTNINNVFSYINLQNIFENNNKVDDKKVLASILKDDLTIDNITLKEINDKATELGFYINERYEVLQYNLGNNNSDRYISVFDRKYIDKDIVVTKIKESQFIQEVYLLYAEYLKLNNYFNNTNFNYIIRYWNEDIEKIFANNDLTLESIKGTSTYVYTSTFTNIVETKIDIDTSSLLIQLVKLNPIKTKSNAYFCANVDTNFDKKDNYYLANKDLHRDKIYCAVLVIVLFISVLIFIFSLLKIFIPLFIKKNIIINDNNKIIEIPIEIIFLIDIIVIYICSYFTDKLFKNNFISQVNDSSIETYINIGVIYIVIFLFIIFVIYQYENGYFDTDIYKKSLIFRIRNNTKIVMSKFPKGVFFATMIIPIIALVFSIIICIYFYIVYNNSFAYILGIVLIIVSSLIIAYILLLNNAYVNTMTEQIKSTTTSTKLITNISHDLRTPLTSIINYSDLINREIKKDDYQLELVKNYCKVINDKSQKLKILLDDLILASKASSRNIDLHFEKIDINEFIEQVFGEFEDRFIEKKLKFVPNVPDKTLYINADGNELYRVFQNLISNIINYGLEDTRIHLTVVENRNIVEITIKNISKNEINMSMEELTDRFSRGDNSRNSEGFGLGLSIAKDLVLAMNGKFKLKIDGDLFVVLLEFLKI